MTGLQYDALTLAQKENSPFKQFRFTGCQGHCDHYSLSIPLTDDGTPDCNRSLQIEVLVERGENPVIDIKLHSSGNVHHLGHHETSRESAANLLYGAARLKTQTSIEPQ